MHLILWGAQKSQRRACPCPSRIGSGAETGRHYNTDALLTSLPPRLCQVPSLSGAKALSAFFTCLYVHNSFINVRSPFCFRISTHKDEEPSGGLGAWRPVATAGGTLMSDIGCKWPPRATSQRRNQSPYFVSLPSRATTDKALSTAGRGCGARRGGRGWPRCARARAGASTRGRRAAGAASGWPGSRARAS